MWNRLFLGCATVLFLDGCSGGTDAATQGTTADAGPDASTQQNERSQPGRGGSAARPDNANDAAGADARTPPAGQGGNGSTEPKSGGKGGHSGDSSQGGNSSAAMSGGTGALRDASQTAGRGGAAAGSGGSPIPDAGARDEDAGPEDRACRTHVSVRASGTASVWLVIDASGSMVDMLGTSSRWDALHEALLNPSTGLVKSLEGQLRWGLMLYDGPLPGGGASTPLPDGGVLEFPAGPTSMCPRTQVVEPQLNNYSALAAAFPMLPLGGSTPTDRALETLTARFGSAQASDGPVSVVLATDGAPNDFCSNNSQLPPPDVRPAVISAVSQLLKNGVTTYALSLAAGDQMLTEHLSQVAAAGGTGKSVFTPSDTPALSSALREIVGKQDGCSVRLASRISLARACEGTVTLEGTALKCGDANGFSLHDETTLQLSGQACERYRAANAPKLDIDYPCSALPAPQR